MRRYVARVDELWDGEMRAVMVGHVRLLIVRHEGRIRVYEDRCPHQRAALSRGHFENGVLTCPAHEYQFDVLTGRGINPKNLCLGTYPVVIEDGSVWVDIDSQSDVRRLERERVGPVLDNGDLAQGVIAAIRRCNVAVNVEDRGSYLRVLVPGRCRVTRVAIERELRRPFELPGDLEAIMPSFKGAFSVTSVEALWEVEAQ